MHRGNYRKSLTPPDTSPVPTQKRLPLARSTSAKQQPYRDSWQHLNLKSRSSSARAKPEKVNEQPPEEPEEVAVEEQHRSGCPRLKARSRSKYGLGLSESNPGMHPKPWGARDPMNIPCFCHLKKNMREGDESAGNTRSNTRADDLCTKKKSKAKIADIANNLGVYLERKKIRVNENEFNMLMKKIEEKVLDFVDKPPTKQEEKPTARKAKNVHSLSPLQRQQTPISNKSSRDHLLELQKAKAATIAQANLLGKVETKKYYMELGPENDDDFKHLFGNFNPIMNSQDKMLIAVEDKPYLTAVPADNYGGMLATQVNYTGVQLRHQAENTTLLLAPNIIARRQPQLTLRPRESSVAFKSKRS